MDRERTEGRRRCPSWGPHRCNESLIRSFNPPYDSVPLLLSLIKKEQENEKRREKESICKARQDVRNEAETRWSPHVMKSDVKYIWRQTSVLFPPSMYLDPHLNALKIKSFLHLTYTRDNTLTIRATRV